MHHLIAIVGMPRAGKKEATSHLVDIHHFQAVPHSLNTTTIQWWLTRNNVVLEGLDTWEAYKALKERFSEMFVLAVTAPFDLRWERLRNDPNSVVENREDCMALDEAALARGVGNIIALADIPLRNNGELGHLHVAIDRFLRDGALPA
jgi:hypothetical protein